MPKHDFSALYAQYPAVIAEMPETFDSHQFILALAKQNQVEYIQALYAYRDTLHVDKPAPFQFVHGRLAIMLKQFPELVELVKDDKPSPDIFGLPGECAEWRKVK